MGGQFLVDEHQTFSEFASCSLRLIHPSISGPHMDQLEYIPWALGFILALLIQNQCKGLCERVIGRIPRSNSHAQKQNAVVVSIQG